MSSVKFVKSCLGKMFELFPDIQIRYEYREQEFLHIVEILPEKFFSKNKKYIDFEIELTEKFENTFTDETILFVSENSLTQVKNPILVCGKC
jgi:DNA-directed RNA polymerase subunit E'/Rpb7